MANRRLSINGGRWCAEFRGGAEIEEGGRGQLSKSKREWGTSYNHPVKRKYFILRKATILMAYDLGLFLNAPPLYA